MLLRQVVKATLPNTQIQTQGGWQSEDAKKYGPNERTEKNSRGQAVALSPFQVLPNTEPQIGDMGYPTLAIT